MENDDMKKLTYLLVEKLPNLFRDTFDELRAKLENRGVHIEENSDPLNNQIDLTHGAANMTEHTSAHTKLSHAHFTMRSIGTCRTLIVDLIPNQHQSTNPKIDVYFTWFGDRFKSSAIDWKKLTSDSCIDLIVDFFNNGRTNDMRCVFMEQFNTAALNSA